MVVHNKDLEWYVDKLKNREYFSQGMYGDGEWIGIFKDNVLGVNAENTVYTENLCDDLIESLHFKSDNFFFSVPAGLHHVGLDKRIDKFLKKEGLEIEFYEKDMWDLRVRNRTAQPFIKQLREMNVIIISNKALRGLNFLNYDYFVEVDYPNCYQQVEDVVKKCKDYGKPGVYLFSMGLPATLAVQKLHGSIPNSFFIDVGSIWDAFVGIGSQRGWRAELYANPTEYEKWKGLSLQNI